MRGPSHSPPRGGKEWLVMLTFHKYLESFWHIAAGFWILLVLQRNDYSIKKWNIFNKQSVNSLHSQFTNIVTSSLQYTMVDFCSWPDHCLIPYELWFLVLVTEGVPTEASPLTVCHWDLSYLYKPGRQRGTTVVIVIVPSCKCNNKYCIQGLQACYIILFKSKWHVISLLLIMMKIRIINGGLVQLLITVN